MTDAPSRQGTAAETSLHRRLKRELECRVERTERFTWTTSSKLPHEIRVHVEAGVQMVRVSAGMVVGTKPAKALLQRINRLNIERALTRRIVVAGTVTIVAEMPLASLRKGGLEQLIGTVHCLARLDAPLLADYEGLAVTDLHALAPDMNRQVEDWPDLLQASGTATLKELQVWLDDYANCDCLITHDVDSVTVYLGTTGEINEYPFSLDELPRSVENLQMQAEGLDDE